MENTEKVALLNELLTKNYDAEAGYKTAAEKVDNPSLKNYLEDRAQSRYQFGHQLKQEITALGGEPDKGTSIAGDLHRAWLGLRDAFTSGDSSVYDECVRGEKAFVEEYQEVLEDEHLPHSVRPLVEEQKASAERAITALESMTEFAN